MKKKTPRAPGAAGTLRPAGLVLLLALLLPGMAFPYWIQHTRTDGELDPAVNPEQYRPAGDGSRPGPDNHPVPVTVEVLALPRTWEPEVLSACLRAIENWNLPGSAMQVIAVRPAAGDTYDPDWASRNGVEDKRNTIEFVTEDWLWGSDIIAKTVPVLDPVTGRMIEADIFCNARDFNWLAFPFEGEYPGLKSDRWVDVEAVVTHEMGHLLGLGHSQVTYASMHANIGLADTRARHITSDDRMGIRALYPETAEDAAAPSIWKIAQDSFSDELCGMSYITPLVGLFYSRRLEMSAPLPEGPIPFCLFGSGFSQERLCSVDLVNGERDTGLVSGGTWISPNFIRATIANGASLGPGAYDFLVEHSPGSKGELSQGLMINLSSNQAPFAVIQPDRQDARPGTWVYLDGSGSIDPDGDTLTYQWDVQESPLDHPGVLASTTASCTSLYLAGEGLYVVQLAVSDGIIESIEDRVLVRAAQQQAGPSEDDGGYSPFGCAVRADPARAGAAGMSQFIIACLPALIVLLCIKMRGSMCQRL